MKVLDHLAATSSRIDKERILRDLSIADKEVFRYTYNPYYMFHVTNFDVDMSNLGYITPIGYDILDKLRNRVLTGNAARDAVEQYAYLHGDLIKLICKKDLKCGVSATTLNKVFPGLVPQFKVQLAKEVALDEVKYPCYAQIKYDGVRLIAIKKYNDTTFFTRNGKEVNLPSLSKAITKSPMSEGILDGEITLESGKMEDRTKVSGMINSAIHGGKIDEDKLSYNVFDTMSIGDWQNAKCLNTYEQRLPQVDYNVSIIDDYRISIAINRLVNSEAEVNELYKTVIDNDYEGLILKPCDHLYTFKRSKDWVKIKEIKTADLECVMLVSGIGKYTSMIGSLCCKGIVEGKQVTVHVGSGLSDNQRDMADEHYLNKTIEVRYNTLIQDSVTQTWSLFLPRFVQVRIDK